jgi:hypothetical protein
LHHFFEAQVRKEFGQLKTFLSSALALQKNVTTFFPSLVWNYGHGVQVVPLYIQIGLFFSIEKKK